LTTQVTLAGAIKLSFTSKSMHRSFVSARSPQKTPGSPTPGLQPSGDSRQIKPKSNSPRSFFKHRAHRLHREIQSLFPSLYFSVPISPSLFLRSYFSDPISPCLRASVFPNHHVAHPQAPLCDKLPAPLRTPQLPPHLTHRDFV